MEAGRVKTLNASIDLVNKWMKKVSTDTKLRCAIIVFAKGRGSKKVINTTGMKSPRYAEFAVWQDIIGWR